MRLVGLKLLVQPSITAVFAFGVFSMPPLWSHSALLLSALPIGTGPFMLAKLYNREAAVTSRAILISTVLSLITVSALLAWLHPA
jgi:predicted permease